MRIIILIFFIPLKLFSQELKCKEIMEPVGWIRKSRLAIDLQDFNKIDDSTSVIPDYFILPVASNLLISDTSRNYSLKLIEGDLKSNKEYNDCALTLLVVNNTDSLVEVATLDGILLAVPEIYYNEKWFPIEYFMVPECGNSYWNIPLKSGKCYKVLYERYLGTSISKLRYKMKLNGKYIVSNSIDSKFNIGQLILDNNQIEYPIINFKD